MKKVLIILMALAILSYAAITLGGGLTTPFNDPGIQGTPHDIPTAQSVSGEPCAFCHTPHVPTVATLRYPLWNRSIADATAFSMYTSFTFNMYTGAATKTAANLDDSTRACMECHNGTTGSLINYPGPGVNASSPDAANYDTSGFTWSYLGNLGTDLRQEHPVAFIYDPGADSDNNGFPVQSSLEVDNFRFYNIGGGAGTYFGCGTCHEPHDRFTYYGKTTTQVFFLRDTGSNLGNAYSDLCRTCHVNRY